MIIILNHRLLDAYLSLFKKKWFINPSILVLPLSEQIGAWISINNIAICHMVAIAIFFASFRQMKSVGKLVLIPVAMVNIIRIVCSEYCLVFNRYLCHYSWDLKSRVTKTESHDQNSGAWKPAHTYDRKCAVTPSTHLSSLNYSLLVPCCPAHLHFCFFASAEEPGLIECINDLENGEKRCSFGSLSSPLSLTSFRHSIRTGPT